jgi:hypothetical protein
MKPTAPWRLPSTLPRWASAVFILILKAAIEDMRRKGLNVRPVVKGKDSEKNGIDKVRELLKLINFTSTPPA